MKYLIVGKNGQLAKAFARRLESIAADYFAPEESRCDITNTADVRDMVKSFRPGVIINCAAYNQVNRAEQEQGIAFAVNAEGPRILAEAARDQGALLVHFGSDYVFDGAKENGLYGENDVSNPLNVYGRSKLAGEQAVQVVLADRSLIFRLSWVFGEAQQNFIAKLLAWRRTQEFLRVACDEISVPTWTETVVEATLKALETGVTDRAARLCLRARRLGLDARLSDRDCQDPAARPRRQPAAHRHLQHHPVCRRPVKAGGAVAARHAREHRRGDPLHQCAARRRLDRVAGRTAYRARHAFERRALAQLVVVITDGYVSIEKEAMDLVRANLGTANVFAFGIGSSVNRHLVEGLARAGRGESFVVLNAQQAAVEADRFRSYIEAPVLTRIRIDFRGFDAYEVDPPQVPDLFAQRPIVVGPSAIALRGGEMPRPLSTADVQRTVEQFAQAARRARDAGFDAVEIHAAHGYLLNQFISPLWNHRDDQYGGSTENRARILVEIVHRSRELLGDGFPIIVRLCVIEFLPDGIDVEEGCKIARLVETAGADLLDVTGGIGETFARSVPATFSPPYGSLVPLAAAVKEIVKIPVVRQSANCKSQK